MAAAYALTADPARHAAFDVTVVSQGWRIGGKGASGRNAAHSMRIEEHGLHIFLGFYRTAFSLLDQAYDRLDGAADGVYPSVADAFTPQHDVTLWASPDNGGSGDWRHYTLPMPRWPGMPWQGSEEDLRAAPQRTLGLLRHHAAAYGLAELHPHLDTEPKALGSFLDRVKELRAEAALGLHVLYDLLEIGGAVLRGYFTDILPHGWNAWDAINGHDFRAWLISHGASETAAWSESIRVIYDLAFAYRDGQGTGPGTADIAAGACLKLMLDLVGGYRGAPMWRMNAGMGDTIFTPLVKCVEQAGGEIRLFRRITAIEVENGAVARVKMQVQARPAGASYDPFIRVKGLDCWPSEPIWDRLAPDTPCADFENPWDTTHVGEEVLEAGTDFDHVVLAIPPAAAQHLVTGIDTADWTRMISTLAGASVATHSVQLWFDRPTPAAGWSQPDTVSGAYAPALGTWADMSHLLKDEDWPMPEAMSCQYLVSVTPLPDLPPPGTQDPQVQAAANAAGQADTKAWLDAHSAGPWPALVQNGVFDESAVVTAYDHVNIAPSELYVRTPPGTVQDRLPPDWDGVANMSLAGDWTLSSINGGSAEAAIESGKAAGDALAAKLGVV